MRDFFFKGVVNLRVNVQRDSLLKTKCYIQTSTDTRYIIFPYFHQHHNKRRPTPLQHIPTWVAGGPPHPQKVDKIFKNTIADFVG